MQENCSKNAKIIRNYTLCLCLGIALILPCSYRSNPPLSELCRQFDRLNTQVRDGSIEKQKATGEFKTLIARIHSQCKPDHSPWHFPVKGYSWRQIGGQQGNGYQPGGYNYFDGNRHKGHPAHDIFVYDKNQDCLDDRSQQPVDILSVSGGIVVALENNWENNSLLRGGKYVWVYDPASQGLFYYAHNKRLLVEVGQQVQAGQKIAEMGRSGRNAALTRSPTHLHIMYLKIQQDLPVARDIYKQLVTAKLNN